MTTNAAHTHAGNNSVFTGPPDPDCFICNSIKPVMPDRQVAVLAKLGEITQTAIGMCDALEDEEERHEWNRTCKTGQEKSTVVPRTTAARLSQELRVLVKELHAL